MSALVDSLFQEILLACQRVYAVADATPLEMFRGPSLPFRLFLKREDLGPVKSYKWRGAYNRMALLSAAERGCGVVTASAGNHAQGVALAASLLGVRARVFMPRSTPEVKRSAVAFLGGDFVEIVLQGDSFEEASHAAVAEARETRRVFVHPYDDLQVMGGQGTLAVEIAKAAKAPFHAAVLQIGGGGMAGAVACWLKRQYPGILIIGVEGEGQASMAAARAAGAPVALPHVDIFCDGTAVPRAGLVPFEACEQLVDEYVTVTNGEVCWAMQNLWEGNRIITETSGAMGVAAALKIGERLRGWNVLAVLSGANIDFGTLGYVTRNSNIGGATRRHLRVRIAERPGEFLRLLGGVFQGCNIVDLQYGRTDAAVAWYTVGVAIPDDALRAICRRLDAAGIAWEDVSGRADVAYRMIRYERALVRSPVFLNLDFYERPGALHDFLSEHVVTQEGDICYFDYTHTAERVGHALLGIEFGDGAARARFLAALPSRGSGFRSCRVVTVA
ncbi:MAG: pyridoxal-phosphate dependent enzyme [Puniceicoccales bacterium]|jgi:threonine dehydratase|nr:pyridoxal-phosphate dependent enzyme [Puniceicoccales bacterium]